MILGVVLALVLYVEFQMRSDALPRYGKGGVARIAQDTYVLTHDARNVIQRKESVVWQGDTVAKPQSAFVVPVFVQFRPGQIRYFDFSTFRGGNYLRDDASHLTNR